MSNSIFAGFKSEAVTSNVLPEGEHVVEIVKLEETDSFTNLDGTPKLKDRPYVDACPQLAVMFRNDKGVITNRFNGMGYYKEDDFAPEEIEEKGLTVADTYVLAENENGDKTRIQHDVRTEKCQSIFNQLFNGLNLPEGSDIADIKPGMKLVIRVKESVYDNKKQYNVAGYRKHVEGVEAPETSEAGTMEL